ncbi:MAG: serine hydrolase domain-containing protein [Acidobacteriota bacterium]
MSRMVEIAVGLALIACSAIGQPKGPADPTDRKLKAKIDLLASKIVAKEGPGFSVAVVKDQKILLCEAYGLANVETGTPMTTETVLNVGSVSKHFTAWAILLLEQRGLLSTADDVHKHLPELPGYGSPLTLAHLLYQTSGLPEYLKLFKYAGLFPSDHRTFSDVHEILKAGAGLEYPPGTRWSYSNTNYALLAEIIQRRTGQTFSAWIQDNLFGPLGMGRTRVPESEVAIVEDRAESYWCSEGALKKYITNARIPGPTLVYTSAADMARWMLNFRNNQIGGAALFEKLCTPGRLTSGEEAPYAMGLAQGQYRGNATVGHAGSDAAFVSDMTYCPQSDLGVAVLCNSANIDPLEVRNAVLDLVLFGETSLKRTESKTRAAPPFPSGEAGALRERLLGTYRLEGGGDLVCLSVDGEETWGTYLGQGNVRLIPKDGGSVSNAEGDIVVRALAPEAGPAEKIELNLKGTLLTASRIPESTKEPAGPAAVTGLYYSPVLGAVYSITREDGRLKVSQRRSVGTHDLACAGKDILVCSLGELRLARDAAGDVTGFTLWHESVGGFSFSRVYLGGKPARG